MLGGPGLGGRGYCVIGNNNMLVASSPGFCCLGDVRITLFVWSGQEQSTSIPHAFQRR